MAISQLLGHTSYRWPSYAMLIAGGRCIELEALAPAVVSWSERRRPVSDCPKVNFVSSVTSES